MKLVDVHTHLTHEKFQNDLIEVISSSQKAGLKSIIVNGLEPDSNRYILELAERHPIIKAALGIYPLDAVNNMEAHLPFAIKTFDIEKEITFIESQIKLGRVFAIGECGLDGHWLKSETFSAQEAVFERLIDLSKVYDLPLIIHTRKLEVRSMEILRHHKAERVNFHCFGGRTKHALRWAEEFGWYFSIPANARRNQSFTKLLKSMDKNFLLTETDAPYLPPKPGDRNWPGNVKSTVAYFAELRDWTYEAAEDQIWQNYCRLFRDS